MMKKILRTYKTFDIVIVPFPFVDSAKTKNRPAIVISCEKTFNKNSDHTILAMITSSKHSPWPLDVEIKNLNKCGLEKKSIIRLKFFTLDNRLIKNKIGHLNPEDKKKLKKNIKLAFNQVI